MPTVSWQSASGAALALAALLWAWRSRARRHEAENATGKVGAWDYGELVKTVRSEGLAMPAMLVLLPAFDRNAARLAAVARAAGKTIRLGTKSLRVPELIFRALASSDVFQGVLCFSVEEAALLYGLRPECRDLLVAYPTVSREDVRCAMRLTQQGARVTLMVDSLEHVALLAQLVPELRREASLSAETRLRVCIDVDMSSSLLGLHLGVQRSPIRSVEQFEAVLEAVLARKESLFLCGVMGYEAHVAGLPDALPTSGAFNLLIRLVKWFFRADVRSKRERISLALRRRNMELEFFNGGGTGSIDSTSSEPWITEVTVGSGLLQSALFDYFTTSHSEPAFCFALCATRKPQPGVVTCQSGGFVASGAVGPEKLPVPFLPVGCALLADEGCGEVQTPVRLPRGARVELGEPILFRPAKAGEVAEHFAEYALLDARMRVVGRAPTYRGLGRCLH